MLLKEQLFKKKFKIKIFTSGEFLKEMRESRKNTFPLITLKLLNYAKTFQSYSFVRRSYSGNDNEHVLGIYQLTFKVELIKRGNAIRINIPEFSSKG